VTHTGRAEARSQGECLPLESLFGYGPGHYGSRSRHEEPPVPGLHSGKKRVKEETHKALLESNIVNMSRLRISTISFLNTVPLMWDFEHGPAGMDFDIAYTVPSACAAELQAGNADIGIIPAAAYGQIPDLAIIPGVAIAARRPVRSILLVSKVPLERIRKVALDTSSMTSVALTKVLFDRWLGSGRSFTPMAPDVDSMLREHDAGLVIGDAALRVDRSKYLAFDLAEEWIRFTGKPFVFAFWAVRRAALEGASADLASIFQKSRDHGLQAENIEIIAREWAERVSLSEAEARLYLTKNIHYHLDAGCIEGLQLFYRYAAECGALPPSPPLHFLEIAKFATT
jgi:chorismate dehydratase